ncbi:hypothetical protein B0H13DRAFT_1855328 [Mycena leptocephala]|nr:hypothetical protein B0H13DRAFT_1855328 [Mycena leptocephala]
MLPAQLEREIFEIAGLSRPTSIATLMRVAWRVNECSRAIRERVRAGLPASFSPSKRNQTTRRVVDFLVISRQTATNLGSRWRNDSGLFKQLRRLKYLSLVEVPKAEAVSAAQIHCMLKGRAPAVSGRFPVRRVQPVWSFAGNHIPRVPQPHKTETHHFFFRNSVYRLFIDDVFGSTNYADMAAILSACCRVTDLFVNVTFSPLIPVMDSMRFLTRLAVDLDQLFGTLSCDFTHSAFTHLTHLEVYGTRRMEEISNGLSLIPNLTHLAFDYLGLILKAAQILQTWPRL